jgi:hypothetical protein
MCTFKIRHYRGWVKFIHKIKMLFRTKKQRESDIKHWEEFVIKQCRARLNAKKEK